MQTKLDQLEPRLDVPSLGTIDSKRIEILVLDSTTLLLRNVKEDSSAMMGTIELYGIFGTQQRALSFNSSIQSGRDLLVSLWWKIGIDSLDKKIQ